ncbi:MAG: CoA transferase [Actinomycetota bacterium]|nr:CoA transferase [Actinomycetota bacterium]
MEQRRGMDPAQMLEGVRVLDFTQYLAGPSCTRLLMELGADVIKVELPPDGDPSRPINPQRNGMSGLFAQQNRGKRSVVLDLREPASIDAIKRIIPRIDVVVENGTPGLMDRRGLGYAELSALNPRLIMASVSGFGQTGRYSHRPCFDFIAQGMAGLMHMTGEPDGPPYFVGIGVGDTNAGVHAFAGIGYALYQRDRTGFGTHIDVSMIDALLHMQEQSVNAASISGGTYVPMRQGRHYQPASPAGTFKGPQGWIVILCMPAQIDGLWAALGRPELAMDPNFADYEARISNRANLTELIETWMSTFSTDDEVLAVLEQHRVPSGPVLSPADAITHPWFIEQGSIRQIDDGEGGTFAVPGFPLRFDGIRPHREVVAPKIGEHTREVLASFGLTPEEIDRLESKDQGAPAD